MNALGKTALDGEILSARDTVAVYGTTHPLNAVAGARITLQLPAGLSITEILQTALKGRADCNRRDLIVHLDGHVIEENNWSRIRVKPGVTLTFMPRLQGGGNTLRTVLSLAVAVAAIFVAPYLAPGIVAGLGAVGITVSIATATALAGAGIMLAGTLALTALFPTRPATQSVTQANLNSIQGANNQGNPFGPVPVVLGTHRQSPFFAARPYTEIVGDKQFLRLLFCLGYGPLAVDATNFKIGETALSSFGDYNLDIRQGFSTDTPIGLFPSTVDEVDLSVTLLTGVWNGQTTAAETDEISLDFTAPQGVFATDPQNNPVTWNVTISTQYRSVSSVTWINAPDTTFTRSNDPTRRGLVISVARGQYAVQVKRVTAAGNSQYTRDTIIWSALRSFLNTPPVNFPKPLALVSLRIQATDQLSGNIDTFNCVNTSLVLAYSGSGSTWTANTASQNPADLFRWVLQGPANARPVPDAQIAITNLQDWWTYCTSNGFKFNQVVTAKASVYDKLCDIAAAGRAVPTFINGQWGVVWDRPSDPIVQHFTPRNSWGFQGQHPYVQQPHGWRVSFINELNGFTQDEVIVYDDGYDKTNATLFEGQQFPGVTDPALNWRHGRFAIAQSRLRPETQTLNVGYEHLVCTKGDRVRVTHDALLIGLAFGRVKSVAGQVITFDEQLTLENGKSYGVQVRVPADARTIDRSVDPTMVAGDYFALTLVGDLSGIAEGNLFAFGLTSQESANYRIKGIAHAKDLIATLTLVDDAPDISTADQGTIPPYNPNITIPPDPFTLPPRALSYLEVIDGRGSAARSLVHLSWQVPQFGKIASFQVQAREDDIGGDWQTVDSVLPPHTTSDVAYTAAGVWSFRVRCIFSDGTSSAWTSLIGINLVGLSAPPGDILNLHQRSIDGQTVLDWDVVADPRTIYYEVRKGSNWDTGLVVGDTVTQPPWATAGDGTYNLRAYVLTPFNARVYSPDTSSISIAGSIISRNIIISNDEQALGWPGPLDGGVIDGSFIRTDTGHSISLPWAAEIVSQLALTGVHIAIYASGTVVDIGRASECRFWTEYEADGILIGADFLGMTDVLGSGDVLGTSPTRFIQAFPVWRFATNGVADAFSPADVFSPTDVFTTGITWGDWVAIASGTRVERYFQPGFVLVTNDAGTNATGTKFKWFVDVPDRTDSYTNLSVPNTGLAVTFYDGGYDATPPGGATAVPFNAGPNGSTVPHIQRAIINGTNGDEVRITSLTLSGCTVTVINAGVAVARSGVNLLAIGY